MKTHPIFYFLFPIPFLVVDSHMVENLKIGFQPDFHPK
jgi:hypothetical protein